MIISLDPIIKGQLDTIQKEGLRNNEAELNLPENTEIYAGLYESGISKEELARRIIDQWNITDSKDNFADTTQIQKANSYANFIINDQATQQQIQLNQHTQNMDKRRSEIQAGQTMKIDDLKDLLEDKVESAEENAEIIVGKAKTRIMQTIDRYTKKIKDIGTANETEKEKLNKELADIKAELKKEKENYEKVKKDFFEDIGKNYKDFSKEEIKKLPIRLIHYKQREGLFNKPDGFNSISAIRRRKAINTFIKKFNTIGTDHKNGVRFIMNFHKDRFLRYSDIKIGSAIDKLGGNMGLQMNPQQFHEMFNKGKKDIKEVLRNPNAGKLEDNEEKTVTAIENRINYYGAAYAKERANARVNPFIEAEKNAKENEKIIETPKTIELNSKQEVPQQNAA